MECGVPAGEPCNEFCSEAFDPEQFGAYISQLAAGNDAKAIANMRLLMHRADAKLAKAQHRIDRERVTEQAKRERLPRGL